MADGACAYAYDRAVSEADFVDSLIGSWGLRRPDLDVTPVAVTTRLGRVRDHLEGRTAALLGAQGLTPTAFLMLATLMRLPEGVTEAQVAEELGLTVGTIGGRIDRLVEEGLVARGAEGAVTLTPSGQALAERVVPAHLADRAEALAALTPEEQATLGDLLRKLLLSFEGPA